MGRRPVAAVFLRHPPKVYCGVIAIITAPNILRITHAGTVKRRKKINTHNACPEVWQEAMLLSATILKFEII